MASFGYRRNFRSGRSQRRRNDSEDENVNLDWNKAPRENLQEILYHVTRKEGVSKGQKLGYLNCFTKFCVQIDIKNKELVGLSLDDLFYCLRVALFDEAWEVRAAALRATRYLVRDDVALESLYRLNLTLLISRSIDIVLDNRLERIQAFRLLRHLLSLKPELFPLSLTRCLVAIAKGGLQERDVLMRASWAVLAELILLNPEVCASAGGLSAIVGCVLQGNQTHNICEALVDSILFLINFPQTRNLINGNLDLQHFVAPFTDLHGCGGEICETFEQREGRLIASRNVLISLLRSWPGMIYLCRFNAENDSLNGIESIINMLHLPYPEIRRHIMELIFELFYLKIPDFTGDFESALISCDVFTKEDTWHLYDGFVAAEGKSILPHIAKHRLNLIDNYLSILLFALVNHGLLDGLVSVIVNPIDSYSNITATILLGELLHLSNVFLPSECAQQCHSLPSLVAAATSSSSEERKFAHAAISHLNRMHAIKRRAPVPHSLYLDQLLQFCGPSNQPSNFENTISKNKLRSCLRKEIDDSTIIQSIKDSQVIGREFECWDWDLVDCILKWPGENLRKIEDTTHKAFVKRLLTFYKPSSKMFSYMSENHEKNKIITTVGCHFLDFLLDIDESRSQEYTEDFLSDLSLCLSEIIRETPPLNAVLGPTRILSTMSHSYFLFIGRLSNSHKGKKLLERAGIFQYLMELVTLCSHDAYLKLIVSSLDYTQEAAFSRTLLTKVLTCSSAIARLYATNYLRILLRANLSDFRKWAMELLVQQLYDKSSAVTLAAVNILDEACDDPENLASLISLRPSLLHIGDKGLLLLLRYLSVPNGFKFLKNSNFLDYELKRWRKVFNLKYVKIIEDVINEALTFHQRSEEGTYGRRCDKRFCWKPNAFIPPHMYGTLVQTTEGLNLLCQEQCLDPLYSIIRNPDVSRDLGVVELKAALWAIGHVGASSLGFRLITEAEIIPLIVRLAAESSILSIRGTCFFVLGLLATTQEGADAIKEFGWESVRHAHNELFPLVQPSYESFFTKRLFGRRQYTWSISSTATRLTDVIESINPNVGLLRNDSFVMQDCFKDCDEIINVEDFLEIGDIDKSPQKRTLPNLDIRSTSTLPRLSPFRKEDLDARPRSSSDCHAGLKNENEVSNKDEGHNGHWNIGISSDSMILETSSVISKSELDGFSVTTPIRKAERRDSGMIDDLCSVTLSTPNIRQRIIKTPRRKISEPGTLIVTVSKDCRSDSNESSQTSSCNKSRSGSYAESTSGVSAGSCDSGSTLAITQMSKNRKLSPIASLSSISNSFHNNGITNSRPPQPTPIILSGFSVLPRHGSSVFLASPDGKDSNFESIPSVEDAQGYATLREIQKRRISALGIHHCLDLFNNSSDQNGERDTIDLDKALLIRRISTSDEESNSSTCENDDTRHMGLCLPLSLAILFTVPKSETLSKKCLEKNEIDVKNEVSEDGLEMHDEKTCLYCVAKRNDSSNTSSITTPSLTNLQKCVSNIDSPLNTANNRLTVESDINHPSSLTSSGSFEAVGPLPEKTKSNKSTSNRILNRREVLRLVTNLSGSVHAKQAEQGLLNLKQKCPEAFDDICLYSEICLQLATYNFRLPARRFLHEIFFDISFDEIYNEADRVLQKLSGNIPAN